MQSAFPVMDSPHKGPVMHSASPYHNIIIQQWIPLTKGQWCRVYFQWWIPLTKGQWCILHLHTITSSSSSGFPTQRASDAVSISMSWGHHRKKPHCYLFSVSIVTHCTYCSQFSLWQALFLILLVFLDPAEAYARRYHNHELLICRTILYDTNPCTIPTHTSNSMKIMVPQNSLLIK